MNQKQLWLHLWEYNKNRHNYQKRPQSICQCIFPYALQHLKTLPSIFLPYINSGVGSIAFMQVKKSN